MKVRKKNEKGKLSFPSMLCLSFRFSSSTQLEEKQHHYIPSTKITSSLGNPTRAKKKRGIKFEANP